MQKVKIVSLSKILIQNILKAFKIYFCNFCRFKGRSNRQEFFVINLIYYLLDFLVDIDKQKLSTQIILIIILSIPSFAVMVRRLHDFELSGYYVIFGFFTMMILTYYFRENNFVLKNLTVIIWSVTLLLTAPFLIIKGTEGSNKYGSPPKY